MTRRCSHCNSNGHNTRTCSSRSGGGVRLFGVRLTDGSFIKKSASMGNLSHYSSALPNSPEAYHSDDPDLGPRQNIRKKGIPWTEEEHRKFLFGLQKLGKGDWRGISKLYVPSRTPTQVASHAQKHFIRQTNATRRKKRTSLFDMVPNMETSSSMPEQFSMPSTLHASAQQMNANNSQPCLDLSLRPFQLWASNPCCLDNDGLKTSHQPICRTVPIVGMSQLTLGETSNVQIESSPLSLALPGTL